MSKKRVIYTAIINNYDTLKEPRIITPGWEYICFTNNPELKSDTWNILYNEDLNTIKKVRSIKILSPIKYDECIWVDGSILINCNLTAFVEKYCKDDFVLLQHPHRNCIYQEARECIRRRKDNPRVITKQVHKYRLKGYPDRSGLVATGLIYKKQNENINKFCQEWNSHVQAYSYRDQLSFNFVAYNMMVLYNLIPFNVLGSEFILNKHNT